MHTINNSELALVGGGNTPCEAACANYNNDLELAGKIALVGCSVVASTAAGVLAGALLVPNSTLAPVAGAAVGFYAAPLMIMAIKWHIEYFNQFA